MDSDYAEEHDVSAQYPQVMAAIAHNFSVWYDTIQDSWVNESRCGGGHKPGPAPKPFPRPGS